MANILHVTHRYWPVQGGSEQFVRQIARRQAREGHQVTVVTTTADDFASFWQREARSLPAGTEQDGAVTVIRIPIRYLPGGAWFFGGVRRLQLLLPPLAARLGRFAPYLPELEQTLRNLGADWQSIFAWNITFDGLTTAACQMAQRCGAQFLTVPLLHLGEGAQSPVRRFYTMPHQLALLQQADHIFVLTAVELTYLQTQNVSPEKMTVVGAAIDPTELAGGDETAFRQKHGLTGPIVAAIGPLTRDKGMVDLLAAAEGLWQNGRSFDLVLAGTMMPDFAARLEKLPDPFRPLCHCLGRISDQEKRDLLAAMTLLALPSRTDSFGLVLLEAWTYGKPVVAARAGGLAAVVDDGENGRLVPFGNVHALSNAISEILDHAELAHTWGENGRQKTSEYTWDWVYENFKKEMAGTILPSEKTP
ncbi:MAG: glycosyltransferase family 4 protein [Chloroflexota bacterium]